MKSRHATPPRAKLRRAKPSAAGATIRCLPATPSRWPDVRRLFGDRGACAGCWCMWPRLSSAGFARGRGAGNQRARIVEGYPLDPAGKRLADAFAWFGLASSFRRARFKEVARRSERRPVMRHVIAKPRARAGGGGAGG